MHERIGTSDREQGLPDDIKTLNDGPVYNIIH